MPKSFSIIGLIVAVFGANASAAETMGHVVGRVTVEQTGAPVAGARVMALTGMSADRPGRQFAHTEARTNENGEYELQVPIGNVQVFPPEPPAGYWIGRKPGYPFEELVVTRNESTTHRDFQVKQAVAWNAKVTTSAGKPVTNVDTFVFRDTDIAQAKNAVNGDGEGHFTTPGDGGKLSLGILDMQFRFFSPKRVMLDIAPNFDPSTAKISAADSKKPTELVDREGRKATIEGAVVVVQNGIPKVQLVADELGPESLGELRGQVVDANGQPIEGAAVMLIGSLPPPADLVHTNNQGLFQFRGPIKWMPEKDQPSTYKLMVLKDGFTELTTKEETFKPDNNGVHQLDKPLMLRRGYAALLRILDADGQPVEGAWVEPGDGLADSAQFTKTDQNGNCVVRNLPVGITRLQLRYGSQWAAEKIVVTGSSATEPAISLRLVRKRAEDAKPEPYVPKPVKTGEMAPTWNIAEWSDGKNHQLSDYRGQVVMINFWGVWCSACVNEIPVIKKLQEKFAGRVAFVGIHTAGGDMSQAKKLLDLKEWKLLVGIDKGQEIVKGETTSRYGVRGYPTNVIIDKQGRIALNTSADDSVGDEAKVMAKMKGLAEEMGMPWPIDKDVSEDEVHSRIERMQEYMLTKEIEKALAQ